MKKINLLLLLFFIVHSYVDAQIGINMVNGQSPLGVFHIDSKGNTITETNGSVSNYEDDVIITEEGRVGLGVLKPSAKLHIKADAPAGNYGLRLEDNTTGTDKMLVSDDYGNASWADQPKSEAKIYNITPATPVTYPPNQQSLVLAMPVETTGNYLVSIRWWGVARSWNAYFRLYEGSNDSSNLVSDEYRDGIEYYTGIANQDVAFSFTVNLFANATAGKFLKISIDPQTDNWFVGTAGPQPLWCPSVILFKI